MPTYVIRYDKKFMSPLRKVQTTLASTALNAMKGRVVVVVRCLKCGGGQLFESCEMSKHAAPSLLTEQQRLTDYGRS